MLSDDRGIELLAMLRARGTEAPAILITSAPSDVLKRRAAAAGAPIVEKPLLDEMLFTEIERLTCAG
jgi:FixJ family two-component response regulator